MSLVDLATVTGCHDQHQQHGVVARVDDPVVTGADPPLPVTADELLPTGRPGLLGQQLDGACTVLGSGARRIFVIRFVLW